MPSTDVPGLEPRDLHVLGGLVFPGEEVADAVAALVEDAWINRQYAIIAYLQDFVAHYYVFHTSPVPGGRVFPLPPGPRPTRQGPPRGPETGASATWSEIKTKTFPSVNNSMPLSITMTKDSF